MVAPSAPKPTRKAAPPSHASPSRPIAEYDAALGASRLAAGGPVSTVVSTPSPTPRPATPPPKRVAEMNPAQLQHWLKSVGFTKQAPALEGIDGEWLAAASDADLSELDGIGAAPQRQSLLNQVRVREQQGGGRAAVVAVKVPDIPKATGTEARANRAVGKVEQVRRAAVEILESAPDGVADLITSAAESALSAAEDLPLVGPACKLIHQMYKSVKRARDNRKSCERFGATLRKFEALLLKAARLDKPATQLKGLESALLTAAKFLEAQSSQGWVRRLLQGKSSSEKFKKLQSAIVEELRLVQTETLLDVAGGVEDLLSRATLSATEAAASEDAETRRAITSKVEELGGLETVMRDAAAQNAVAELMGIEWRVLHGDIQSVKEAVDGVKTSVDSMKTSVAELSESGAHNLIKHEDARRLWQRKFGGCEKVELKSFAKALLDAFEDEIVPAVAPPLDEKRCYDLAKAVDVNANGLITVVEVRESFPRGQSFSECVANLLANDGTLSLPMPPAVFLGRDTHLDEAMNAWRSEAAQGSLVIVAPGGVGKSAFAVTLARRAIHEGFASRAAFVDARGSCATQASLLSAFGAACRVPVDGIDDAPLIDWARG